MEEARVKQFDELSSMFADFILRSEEAFMKAYARLDNTGDSADKVWREQLKPKILLILDDVYTRNRLSK
jgi:hypothetical protein